MRNHFHVVFMDREKHCFILEEMGRRRARSLPTSTSLAPATYIREVEHFGKRASIIVPVIAIATISVSSVSAISTVFSSSMAIATVTSSKTIATGTATTTTTRNRRALWGRSSCTTSLFFSLLNRIQGITHILKSNVLLPQKMVAKSPILDLR